MFHSDKLMYLNNIWNIDIFLNYQNKEKVKQVTNNYFLNIPVYTSE